MTGKAAQLERFVRPCRHQRHEASLAGVDENGHYRSRVAQAYPSEFCQMLATVHLDFMIRAKERPEVPLREEFVETLVDEALRRRRAQVRHVDELPATFLSADG